MNAKKQAKIFSRHRTRLESVLPLAIPFSIEIDPSVACNLRCNFCYQYDERNMNACNYTTRQMDFGLYTKIIDDICSSNERPKKLKLYEFGEPLLHPQIIDMVQYASERNAAEVIEIVSNGTLINRDLAEQLIDAGLGRINFSINGLSNDRYREITGRSVHLDKMIDGIRHMHEYSQGRCVIYVKIADTALKSIEERKLFFDMFEAVCDEIAVEHITNIWNFDDVKETQLKGNYGQTIKKYKKVCPFLFTRMVICADGKVAACCSDWKRSMPIGDMKTQSVREVWFGTALKELQLTHLHGKRNSIPLCKGCTLLSTSTIDDIDEYSEELLPLFEKEE